MNTRTRTALARALVAPLSPALWLYTIYRRRVLGKSLASTRGMWGHLPPDAGRALAQNPKAPVVWIHAVSVGEVMAARVVAKALRQVLEEQQTPARLFLSLTTDTGMEAARAALQAGEVDAVGFYPIDAPSAVRRALNAVRPRVFVVLETELWPLFLSECRARGVRTILANGRVSDRLQKDGARLGFVFAPMLRGFDALLMRSPFDAQRMRALAPGARVLEAGDVKLDAASPGRAAPEESERWKKELAIEDGQLLWVAGSTHPGEEEILARSFAELRKEFPNLRLVIAPRHIERAGEVVAILEKAGLEASRRSQSPASTCSVVVLDTVGELAQIYAAADVAFVGGSLIERGGHNMLEPVLRGVPVAYGPNVANFRVAAALVEESNLGQRVADEAALTQALVPWLRARSGNSAEEARQEFAGRAARALEPHRGASRRVALAIAQALRGEDVQLGE